MRKVVIKNILSNWAGLGFHMVVAFFLAPFLVGKLGVDRYGIWVLFGQIIGYMGLMDLGIRLAVTTYVAKYNAKNDPVKRNEIINSSLGLYTMIAIVIVLFALSFSFIIDHVFKIEPQLENEARLVFIIVHLTLATQLPANVFAGSISGMQRYDIANGISIVVTAIRTAIIVFVIQKYQNLVYLAIITFLFEQVKNGCFVFFSYRILKSLEFRFDLIKPTKERIKKISSFSLKTLLLTMTQRVIFGTDTIVIGALLSTAEVTYYVIGWNLVNYTRNIVMKLSHVLAPAASHNEASGIEGGVRDLMIFSIRSAIIVSLPIYLFLYFFGKYLIFLWMGKDFGISYTVLCILLVADIANVIMAPAVNIVIGIGKHGRVAKLRVIEAILNIGLSIILVKKIGIVGVAIGTMAPALAINFLFVFPYTLRTANLSFKEFARNVLNGPAKVVAILSVILMPMAKFLIPHTWTLLVTNIVIIGMLYILLSYLFILEKEERGYFRTKLFGK